jgi:hypothetical protein
MIPAVKRFVSFRVVRPDSKGNANAKPPRENPSLLTSQPTAKQNKVHIEWNLDLEHARAVLEEGREDSREDAQSVLRKRTRSLHTIKLSEDSLRVPLQAAYEDGQSIEYYSVTHRQWMSGTIEADIRSEKSQRVVYYNVTLTQGRQLRLNVDLDLLREPLSSGDEVEYVSDESNGRRTPAFIANQQSPAPALLGYRVVLERSGKVLDRVPANKLKRRFVQGQSVEVYRGPELGWQKAVVHQAASMDGCNAELLPVPAPPSYAREEEIHKLVAASRPKDTLTCPTPPQTSCTPRSAGCAATQDNGPWTMVPVCEDFDCGTLAPEMIPSCLVRRDPDVTRGVALQEAVEEVWM